MKKLLVLGILCFSFIVTLNSNLTTAEASSLSWGDGPHDWGDSDGKYPEWIISDPISNGLSLDVSHEYGWGGVRDSSYNNFTGVLTFRNTVSMLNPSVHTIKSAELIGVRGSWFGDYYTVLDSMHNEKTLDVELKYALTKNDVEDIKYFMVKVTYTEQVWGITESAGAILTLK